MRIVIDNLDIRLGVYVPEQDLKVGNENAFAKCTSYKFGNTGYYLDIFISNLDVILCNLVFTVSNFKFNQFPLL